MKLEGENKLKISLKNIDDSIAYGKSKMEKDIIIESLKEKGFRITKQRRLIIDTILENECSCCKEIYYKVSSIDKSIGIATVYRLINILDEIGAISRKNMYKVVYFKNYSKKNICTIILNDNTTFNLTAQKWNEVVKSGLIVCGYLKNQDILSITIK